MSRCHSPVTGQTVIAVVAEQDLKLQLPVLVESVGVLLPVQTRLDKMHILQCTAMLEGSRG